MKTLLCSFACAIAFATHATNVAAPPQRSASAPSPLDTFVPYPRAVLARRVETPLDRVTIPLSAPKRTARGLTSALEVTLEGKVTMLQFRHDASESALSIRRHYEAWLAKQGFERFVVCEAPCPAQPEGGNWRRAVDPFSRLEGNFLPYKPGYVAAYKPGAMVLVGVGDYLRLSGLVSLVKVVEGEMLDAQPWRAATRGVKTVTASELDDLLARSQGPVVVQWSSFDAHCQPCIQANPVFDQFAAHRAGKAIFVRVMPHPWTEIGKDPVARRHAVRGVPVTLAFSGGKPVRRLYGVHAVEVMQSKVLDGLR